MNITAEVRLEGLYSGKSSKIGHGGRMCGLAGFAGFRKTLPSRPVRERETQKMLASLVHRGPDEQRTLHQGPFSLGFARLSIVDVAGGSQPIWNQSRNLLVAMNGEIYNYRELRRKLQRKYRFRTDSDAEVALYAYEEFGDACFEKLNGIFAIAIWDTRKKQLVLARDPLGVKPLYYSNRDAGILFASELKGIVASSMSPRGFDWSSLTTDANLGGVTGEEVSSFVQGISVLPAGHHLRWSEKKGAVIRQYWKLEDHVAHRSRGAVSEKTIVERYSELLEQSVLMNLQGEAQTGVFLSGGLDSALIAAIVATKKRDFPCFHAASLSTVKAGETAASRALTRRLALPFHQMTVNSETFLDQIEFDLTSFENLIWTLDSPRVDLESLVKLELHRFAKRRAPDLKVVLLGQGADEFACGYSAMRPEIRHWQGFLQTQLKREAQWERIVATRIPAVFTPWLSPDFLQENASHDELFTSYCRTRKFWLQKHNLWHEDRTAAAFGIENRVPFLDPRLVEFVIGIPPRLRSKLLWDKAIVRLAARNWLSENDRKRGKNEFFHLDSEKIEQRLVDLIFPEFDKKYLKSRRSVFSRERLQDLYLEITNQRQKSVPAMDLLIKCMALECFVSMLSKPPIPTAESARYRRPRFEGH